MKKMKYAKMAVIVLLLLIIRLTSGNDSVLDNRSQLSESELGTVQNTAGNIGENSNIHKDSDLNTSGTDQPETIGMWALEDLINQSENVSNKSIETSKIPEIIENGSSNNTQENTSQDIDENDLEILVKMEEVGNQDKGSNNEGRNEHYIALNESYGGNQTKNSSSTKEQEKRKIKTIKVREGRTVIEGYIPEDFDLNGIDETERQITDGVKEVVIKSSTHLDSPLKVYSDIQKIGFDEIAKIKVYWQNEDRYVGVEEFIDSDKDGYVDRISWIVPHLSGQIFLIKITNSEENASGEDIVIEIIKPSNSQLTNPLEFEFNFSYGNVSYLNCTLEIDGKTIPESVNFSATNKEFVWTQNLQDGTHNWIMDCKDEVNSENSSVSGSFGLNEGFSLEEPDKVYVVFGENLIGDNKNLEIKSTYPSEYFISLVRPSPHTPFLRTASGTSYTIELNRSMLPAKGEYALETIYKRLTENMSINKTFSVVEAEIGLNKQEAGIGEEIQVSVSLHSPIENITSVILSYGPGQNSEVSDAFISQKDFQKTYTYKYTESGNFTLTLNTIIAGKKFTLVKNELRIKNYKDNQAPSIELISPNDEAVINSEKVVFSYKSADDVKISNCTFELYDNTGSFGTLNYTSTKSDVLNNTLTEISLQDFEEGDYSWYLGCYDNSSNYKETGRDLTINFNTTTSALSSGSTNTSNKTKDIRDVLLKVEDFLKKESGFSPEQKEALEDLGISENLTYFQKRLNQINQDLTTNIKFITDEDLRNKREVELLNEFENIKKIVPTDFRIIESKEYSKNSIPERLEETLTEYYNKLETKLKSKEINYLVEQNKNRQRDISVLSSVKKIEITFLDGKREITLISKSVDISNNSVENILERLPAEISREPEFLVDKTAIINGSLYHMLVEDLKDNKIIYYFDEFIDLEKIALTDTISVRDYSLSESSITGLTIIDIGLPSKYFTYFLIIVLVWIVYYFGKKIVIKTKVHNWKAEEDVLRIFNSIEKAKKCLENKDIGSAKETYIQIKGLYPLIPEGCKKYLFKEIQRISKGIDRREIISLAKEYEKAKEEGREEDRKRLYEILKKNRTKLPKKDQEKLRNKVFKDSWE